MKIKAYIDYNEHTNTRYSRDFEIVDTLPEVGSIIWGDEDRTDGKPGRYGQRTRVIDLIEIEPDCQNGDEVWNYRFYLVKCNLESWDDDENAYISEAGDDEYLAIKR